MVKKRQIPVSEKGNNNSRNSSKTSTPVNMNPEIAPTTTTDILASMTTDTPLTATTDISLNPTIDNPPTEISQQEPPSFIAKPTKYLHLVDGEKGGVGKSFFARALCHYFASKEIPVLIVDADTTNPDVSKVYGGEQIAFSENERKSFDADRIFELALENNVLVNLPAQISNIVDSWYERNNILDIASSPDVNIKICKWFVSSGAFDSISLFKDSLEKHGSKIKHILVKNLAFCDASEWQGVVSGLKKEVEDYDSYEVLEVNFPKLAYKERDVMLKDNLRFEAARDFGSVKEKIGILGQQRVKTFLDSAIASIEAAEEKL
jgi:hypothetical protein